MSKDKIKTITVEDMLEAGVHFGHQTRRKEPRMSKFVYSTVKKNQIIDLYKTKEHLEKAVEFVYEVAKTGKQIIIVGTKRQAAPIVAQYARESGALFVNQRWLGGTFTNFDSVEHNLKELERIERGLETNAFAKYTKKERLLLSRKVEKLNETVGGLRGLEKFPGAVIVVDIKREKTAVAEANALNIPVVAMVDTNSNPEAIKYVIPSNDDAIKSIEAVISVLASAIKEGYAESKAEAQTESKPTPKVAEKAPEKVAEKTVKPAEKEVKSKPSKPVVEAKKEKEVAEKKKDKEVKEVKPKKAKVEVESTKKTAKSKKEKSSK